MPEVIFILENATGDRSIVTKNDDRDFSVSVTFGSKPHLVVPIESFKSAIVAEMRACELLDLDWFDILLPQHGA